MITTLNKISRSKIILVTYESKYITRDSLKKLQEDTGIEQYNEMIKSINLLSIENFIENDLFED